MCFKFAPAEEEQDARGTLSSPLKIRTKLHSHSTEGSEPNRLGPINYTGDWKCARVFHLLKTISDTSTDCGTFNWILYMLLKDISCIIGLPSFLILCQSWLPVLLYFEKRNNMSPISVSPSISRKCLSYRWFINIQSINTEFYYGHHFKHQNIPISP